MPRPFYLRRWFIGSLLIILAIIAVQCGGATKPAAPASPVQPTAGSAQMAKTETSATPDASQVALSKAVEESNAAQAKAPKLGATITSDEDVTVQRIHKGGEYHDVATSDAVSFHPYLTTDTASGGYQSLVYTGGLLRLDEHTLDYIPNMADSYSISNDGLTFTFHLRSNMKWSDGQPITAHDFEWTYNQANNPANEFPYRSQLEFIKSYRALDDNTLEVKIDKVYAPALGQISGLITPLPQHVWEKYLWADPERNPEINHPSVVSGPYKLVEWRRDQYAIFEANENYWYKGAPSISRYVIEIVPDQDIAYEKFKTGDSDTGPITPEKLDEARQLPNATVYEWWPAAANWSYLGLNMRDGSPTADLNVRHGLNYALDKQLLTDQVMLGQAKRLCSIYPETSWAYNPDVPCYDYDQDKAIAAFAQAGYTFDGEKMVDQNGQQLHLNLIYGPNSSQTRELIAVAVQDFLSRIGIDVEIQALEWSSFLEALHSNNPEWDMYIGAWSSTIDPQIMYTIWSEENIPGLNSVAYVNKQVEELFSEAGGTYDTTVRKEKYGEIQRIIAEDSPYIFLFYNKAWSGQNKRIKGIEPTPLGIGWNQEDWYITQTTGS
jgi:peptide/nickel transport system substrate-binding protein